MRRCTSGLSALVLAGCLAVAAAADYPPLSESPLDIVWLTGGQPLHGLIKESRADGTVVIETNGITQEIPRSRYERIDPRLLAGDSVARRGAAILVARDWDEVLRTVNWAVKHNAKKEALELARAALVADPAQPRLAEVTLGLLNEGDPKPDPKVVEEIVRSVLKADTRWRDGRKMLVKTLTDAGGREDDVEAALAEWLVCAPTDPEPLRAMVAIREKKGDTRGAMNMMRRLWESGKDGAAGISYARLLLRLGDVQRSQEVANQLLDQEATARPAKAIAGTARLIAGKLDEAEPLLRAAIEGELPEDLAPIARYNLALACYRLGKLDEARTLWSAIDQPMARYAIAVLDRQPVVDAEPLKAIAAQVQLHNTMLEVEKRPGGVVLPDEVKALTTPLSRFVQSVMAAFRPSAGPETVRALASYPGPVSQRWQAYAYLVNKRYDEAIAVLDQLPPDDGYAIAYRLHVALERKESAAANELWTRLQASANPPRDWMARMQLVFDAAQHENLVERFDLEGVTPPSGWVYNAFGTGIQVHQQGGKLWFEGKQRKSAEAVTRAWRLVKQEQLKRIIADFDLTAAGTAIAGIEIMDGQRRTGVALGVKADRSLNWRQRGTNGAWSEWAPLAMKAGDGAVKLALEYSGGQVKVFQIEAPDKIERLGDWDGRGGKSNELCVSLFGTADEGQDWKVGVDEVRIELNTKARQQE